MFATTSATDCYPTYYAMTVGRFNEYEPIEIMIS